MQTREVVIVSACRTAIGKFQGQFKDVSARELAITAGKEAIKRAGIDINTIDEVVMGECYPGMQGSLPARQVSMRIGLPLESSAVTVNQNCASGLRAMEIACQNVILGKTDIGLVIGVENMTQAPFMLPKARMGYRMGGIPTEGGAELFDSLIHDALYDSLVPGHMGVTADNVAKLCNVTRKECDEPSSATTVPAPPSTAGSSRTRSCPSWSTTRRRATSSWTPTSTPSATAAMTPSPR